MSDRRYNRLRCTSQRICDFINAHYSYDPETGIIKKDTREKPVGFVNDRGYVIVKVDGLRYKAHHIAWFLHYGRFPEREIDHINGDKTDNRIINLREVYSSENAKNRTNRRKRDPETGCLGIHIIEGLRKKYMTRIQGRSYCFATLEEAKEFRINNGLKL